MTPSHSKAPPRFHGSSERADGGVAVAEDWICGRYRSRGRALPGHPHSSPKKARGWTSACADGTQCPIWPEPRSHRPHVQINHGRRRYEYDQRCHNQLLARHRGWASRSRDGRLRSSGLKALLRREPFRDPADYGGVEAGKLHDRSRRAGEGRAPPEHNKTGLCPLRVGSMAAVQSIQRGWRPRRSQRHCWHAVLLEWHHRHVVCLLKGLQAKQVETVACRYSTV